jgi:hypothetical protein
VSITPDAKETAQFFVKHFQVPWLCVYAAPDETFKALGAFQRYGKDRTIPPTLYVIGRDGRVAWCDQRARYQHADVNTSLWRLEEAIDEALK